MSRANPRCGACRALDHDLRTCTAPNAAHVKRRRDRRNRQRSTLSISAAFLRVLDAGAARLGVTRTQLVELACTEEALARVDVSRVRASMHAARDTSHGRRPRPIALSTSIPRATLDAIAENRAVLARVDTAPGPRLVAEIKVDEGTASMLADLVRRERELHGREVTAGELLDAAINRCLDVLERPVKGRRDKPGSLWAARPQEAA
jgi:hypothetical protein